MTEAKKSRFPLPPGLVEPPDPGNGLVIDDQPMADYLSWHAGSNSRIVQLDESSPAHCYQSILEPRGDTKALRLGRSTHTIVLEPQLAEQFHLVAGPCQAELKSGKRKGEPCGATSQHVVDGRMLCGKHADESDASLGDRVIVPAPDHEAGQGMLAALKAHPDAAPLLFGRGRSEVTVLWTDQKTGVPFRARIDRWAEDLHVWVHLKTTRDASPSFFEREIRNRRYHHTLAYYAEASSSVGLPVAAHAIVAVESAPPHGVVVYDLDSITLDVALDDVRVMMDRYAECHRSGVWPSYPTGVHTVSLVSPFEAERRLEAA